MYLFGVCRHQIKYNKQLLNMFCIKYNIGKHRFVLNTVNTALLYIYVYYYIIWVSLEYFCITKIIIINICYMITEIILGIKWI